jgi:hypothetical protein
MGRLSYSSIQSTDKRVLTFIQHVVFDEWATYRDKKPRTVKGERTVRLPVSYVLGVPGSRIYLCAPRPDGAGFTQKSLDL